MNHDDLLNAFKEILEKQDLSESSITSYLQGITVFTTWALDFYQQEVSLLEITVNDLRAYREYVSKVGLNYRNGAKTNYNPLIGL